MKILSAALRAWLELDWQPDPAVLASLAGAPFRDDDNHRFLFQWDERFYQQRVQMAGFTGARRVLDAGCGFGQWTAALSRFNDQVVAVDKQERMLGIARLLCERWQAPNVSFGQVCLPDLPFADAEFDLVWCYSVVMFTPLHRSLATLARVLEPGGLLYVGMNARGRWLYKWLSGLVEGRPARARTALRALRDGHNADHPANFVNLRDVPALCARHGLELIAAAPDGHLDLRTGVTAQRRPMFPARFAWVFDNNIEFVARKPAVAVADGRAGAS
ncbi:MAG: methyltransferase domain-containing protein [Gammaproteobacteria bacterium]|nr:methyltransferase domain-containing protein [Gammaproteobacteria bacterium]